MALCHCEHTDENVCCVCDVCLCVVCVCVYIPLFLNTSRVPPLSRMGQQVSRSLARTLPVLFWTNWLPRRGCQSSQPFPFHPTALQPLWPQLHFLLEWYGQIQFVVQFLNAGCICHNHFWTISHVLYVYSSVFGRCHRLIHRENFVNLIKLIINRLLLPPVLQVRTCHQLFLSMSNRLIQSAMSFSSYSNIYLISP